MITVPELAAEALGSFLADRMTRKAENARRKAVRPYDSASNSGDLRHGQFVRCRIFAFSTSAVCSYHPMHGLAEAIGRGETGARRSEP
jgi:hypothetical protein